MLKATAQDRSLIVGTAIAAVVLAFVAAGWVVFAPCAVRTESRSRTTIGPEGTMTEKTTSSCLSLLEAEGPGVLIAVGVPVAIATAGMAGAFLRKSTPQIVAGMLFTLAMLASSVFVFFSPTGGLLIASGLLARSRR